MEKKYYLAYGSNLNMEQMKYRCPNARPVGTAVIEDYELLFKGSKTGSYLTIEKKDYSDVPVGVWEVSPNDERALDRYEGFPAFYYKKEIKIEMRCFKTAKIKIVKAFVYIMHENRHIGIPTSNYMMTCMTGYHDFGFDYDVLTTAYKESVRRCK